VNSGKLKHRIEIQNSTELRSASGAVTGQTWHPFCYVWAAMEPLSGKEYFAAAQIQSTISHKITIRYRAGIKPYYRATWNDRIFNIISIINTREENRELILYCTEWIEPDGGV
jgi:SPP1 family predicted phage head-tail adaptor